MLPEIAFDELIACLEQVASELLEEAGFVGPPVNALLIARRAGMVVAYDSRLTGRARTVRLGTAAGSERPSILLRPEPRAERQQWAVAHEVGEQFAHRVF